MALPVVCDASVLIDMEHGYLLEAFFALPLVVSVPDALYQEEIEPYLAGLEDLGLVQATIGGETITYIADLGDRYDKLPSIYDLYALGLARQEGRILLTGDGDLRTLAETEGVDVHGTIWVVERILEEKLVLLEVAEAAFDRMIERGARLPLPEIHEMLDRFRT